MPSTSSPPIPPVIVALGSNQGDSKALIHQAAARLTALSQGPAAMSSLWRSAPIDCPPGSPAFVNAVLGLDPGPQANPDAFLELLQSMEREFGRPADRERNAPRPLDLDLLVWGGLRMNTPKLILPHPRLHVRRFVLAPLAEIAPDLIPPGLDKPVRLWLEQLPPDAGDWIEVLN